jgi:hypothetical protein
MPATILSKVMLSAGVLVLAGVASVFTWRSLKADVEARVYRDRLHALTGEYESLRGLYNDAVRRTAITELVVDDAKRLSVRVRNASGLIKEIPTSLDPTREVYVDYVMIDNRLLIRRVFDQKTPPERGVVIEPELAAVDWDDPAAVHGKAVYRVLGEGRWVITATAGGALGLSRAPGDAEADLLPAPRVRSFDELEREAKAEVERLGFVEILKRALGG